MMDGSSPRVIAPEPPTLRDVRLADRYDLGRSPVLISGVQALLRGAIAQAARDRAAGRRTAGYVTGYRGSPLGGLDLAAKGASAALAAADVTFEPALNEDIAATALWGAQAASLYAGATRDGVFGLWYGKGPGVDRSGDAFRHANLAGAAALGGVIVAAGDDHTCESSTTCHQSEFALVDAQMPILHPAGPQEVLDMTALGWALSRLTGLWVGLKCVKDVVEATTVVDGDPFRIRIVTPDVARPALGLNLVPGESAQSQEERLALWRLPAVAPFARANALDARRLGRPGARIGVVAAGKSWLDLSQALELLEIDAAEAEAIGLTAYKVGLVWPLEPEGLRAFADGLETLLVVEEKRSLIETQAKELLYGRVGAPAILGKRDEAGASLLPPVMDLDPPLIARALGRTLLARAPLSADRRARLEARLVALGRAAEAAARLLAAPPTAERKPVYCSGCPHNTSTVVVPGSVAAAGIGCHYMALWMDRETLGHTHMGGEGAQWIGQSKYSATPHIFQNIGDGTFNHSGLLAVRAAAASGANITYKVLYNDAVALTGGQANDAGLTPYRVADELLAAGVKELVVVLDPAEPIDARRFPERVSIRPRAELAAVEARLRTIPGATAILYVQTCAAEKRRRRKRGAFPDAPRVAINPLVCEGCGDCVKASSCVSVLPLPTELGEKRRIDQSSCNLDARCADGLCPSFLSVENARPRRPARAEAAPLEPDLPEPETPTLGAEGFAALISGVGGQGSVTIGAILGMAAHLEGKGAGVLEMAGLAQKGGAVRIHVRIASTPAAVSAIRVPAGRADLVIAGDLTVAAAPISLGAMDPARSAAVAATTASITGAALLDPTKRADAERLRAALAARSARLVAFDAQGLAERRLGDAIYANAMLVGAAYQSGLLPLGRAAIRRAIELNGAAVAENLAAFELGRRAASDPAAADRAARPEAGGLLAESAEPASLEALLAAREAYLEAYQDRAWAQRFRDGVETIRRAEAVVAPGSERLARAAARSLFKLMSYKDEYEVARLHALAAQRLVAESFEPSGAGPMRLRFHLAPPLSARKGPDGRPRKTVFGTLLGWSWPLALFRLLARGKVLRGGGLDPFGATAERRAERAWIERFERDLRDVARRLSPDRVATAEALLAIPQSIKGFGAVKARAEGAAAERRAALVARFQTERALGAPRV